jgi:hypothetical protein
MSFHRHNKNPSLFKDLVIISDWIVNKGLGMALGYENMQEEDLNL